MANENESIRFEPEERPSHLLSAGLGLQATIILIAPIVVTVAIIMRSANQPDNCRLVQGDGIFISNWCP